jgi:ubiquinone/menaquinone biosynthesis C-methylase UbiE
MDDQREAIAGIFDRAAATYDSVDVDFFSVFGQQLVEDLAISPGERVLDIGCGRGAVLFPAAERVAANGAVLGIDLAPGMVERTAAQARARGLDQVRVEVMDAQEPKLSPSSYDVVASGLVIFFLPDPQAALRNWRELLVDGGRLGFTTFAGDDERWSWLDGVFRDFAPAAARRPGQEKSDSPFRSDDSVAQLVRGAGFENVTSTQREHETTFGNEHEWHEWSWSHGQRACWERVPAEQRDEVKERAFTHLRAMRDEYGSITLRSRVRYTSARG